MANLFRCCGGGNKSLVLPSLPSFNIEPADSCLLLDWSTPSTEVSIYKYYIYKSTSSPSKLSDMSFVASTYTNSFNVQNLTNDINYYIAVQSVSDDGFENASILKIRNSKPFQFKFVAIGFNGSSYYSTDGISWTAMSGIISTTATLNTVAYGNGRFIAFDRFGLCYHSTNGISWNYISDSGFYEPSSLVYGNGRFVCVGYDSKSYYSTDGISWTAMSGIPSNYYIYSVTYWDGKFVAVGGHDGDGYVYYSTDGTSWTYKFLSSSRYYYGITYGNGKFVAVGEDGYAFYSKNGTSWTSSSYIYSDDLRSIAYGNGKFVAVGDYGSALYSTDGKTWTDMSGITDRNDLCSVTYGNGKFVAVGDSGSAYYSTNGTSWNPINKFSSEYFEYVSCSLKI